MVGLPYDCLMNPVGAVRVTFEKAIASGSDPTTFSGKDWGAIDVFRDCLFDQGGLSQVPILDSSSIGRIQPNSLVRFRGMIQDMLGNELYVGAFKDNSTWRTNKFTDVASIHMNSSSETRVWDRHLLYCVPVPGQSHWVVPGSSTESSSETTSNRFRSVASQHGEKRRREDDDMSVDQTESSVSSHGLEGSPISCKKMRDDGLPCQAFPYQESVTGETSRLQSRVPDFDTKSLPCLVKIYDTPETELKLNDVFEFIGVYTFDPLLMVQKDESDELPTDFCGDVLEHLPPNKVPRLHCLIHRKLSVQDFVIGPTINEPMPNLVRGIRDSLLGYLTAVLGNDGVAAQCVLLHLLSQVHARVDNIAVGKLSLNLIGFSRESVSIFGNQLNLAIQNIMPFTQSMPLSVEYLNTSSLAPKKDYQTNRLLTGVLQLPEGTHLTLDETKLNAGTLNSTGVENVNLLKSLMDFQKVEYDFEYFKLEMSTNVQILVLSEGKSNILPADLVLPFHPSNVGSSINADSELLQAWRWYLATLRSLEHVISPELQKVIENDLVEARQEDRSIGSDDFSRWLTMARLMSASFGETSLSLEHWQMVKELERLRKERLK